MFEDIKVVVAIIAALSAIAGALLTQLISIFREFLDKRYKRNVLLREKYEELANLVVSSQLWIGDIVHSPSFDELKSKPPVDARKIVVLANLYFPRLRKQAGKFLDSCVDLQMFMVQNVDPQSDLSVGVQLVIKDEEKYKSSVANYTINLAALDKEIIEHSCDYAKA